MDGGDATDSPYPRCHLEVESRRELGSLQRTKLSHEVLSKDKSTLRLVSIHYSTYIPNVFIFLSQAIYLTKTDQKAINTYTNSALKFKRKLEFAVLGVYRNLTQEPHNYNPSDFVKLSAVNERKRNKICRLPPICCVASFGAGKRERFTTTTEMKEALRKKRGH